MNNREIKEILYSKSEHGYQQFTSSLTPDGKYRFLGVRIPALREIARWLVKEDGIKALNNLSDDSFEELLLQGFVIGYCKMPFEDKRPYVLDYLDKCDSWSLIDSFVSTIKLNKIDREKCWKFLNDIKSIDKPYYIRYVLVTMLNRYLDDDHIDDVLRYTVSIKSDHYYVEMAQAWLLATACIKYNDSVIDILKEEKLNDFVHNKTIQKAIESYRITEEQKTVLRSLRK